MTSQNASVRKFFCGRPGGLLRDLVVEAARLPGADEAPMWIKGDYFPPGTWTSLKELSEDFLESPLTFQTIGGAAERPASGAIFEDHALLRIAGYRCCSAAAWEVHCWDSWRSVLVGPEGMPLPSAPERTLGPFDYWIDALGDAWSAGGEVTSLPEARRLMADYRERGRDWSYARARADSPQPAVRQLAAAVLGWSDRGEECRVVLEHMQELDPDLAVRETAGTSLLRYR